MIPAWNVSGVLPPIRPGEEGHGPDRSPYHTTMTQVVERFCTSADRLNILMGLLNYRQELYSLGIAEGFQWLNGSFMQDIESTNGRSPNVVDVVTFFRLPHGQTQETIFGDPQARALFDVAHTKAIYRVDGYPLILGDRIEEWHVHQISYWYSMWSHTRERYWKGFVRVDLDPGGDAAARQFLETFDGVEAEI